MSRCLRGVLAISVVLGAGLGGGCGRRETVQPFQTDPRRVVEALFDQLRLLRLPVLRAHGLERLQEDRQARARYRAAQGRLRACFLDAGVYEAVEAQLVFVDPGVTNIISVEAQASEATVEVMVHRTEAFHLTDPVGPPVRVTVRLRQARGAWGIAAIDGLPALPGTPMVPGRGGMGSGGEGS